jgi:membrane-bound inhibitor of C-type lysozyme
MIGRPVTLAGFVMLATISAPAFSADVSYTCRDGTQFTASFSPPTDSPGNVVLVIAGSNATVALPQVKAADGGRYANADTEFWIRDKNATLTRAGRGTSCESK